MNDSNGFNNGLLLAVLVIALLWLSPLFKPKASIYGEPGYREPQIRQVEVLR